MRLIPPTGEKNNQKLHVSSPLFNPFASPFSLPLSTTRAAGTAMYPSSSSSMCSSSDKSNAGLRFGSIDGGGGGGLTRYVSAPGSLLRNAVDSVIGSHGTELSPLGSHSQAHLMGHYFIPGSGDSSSSFTSESTCKVNSSNDHKETRPGLQRSYGFNEIAPRMGESSSSSLVRQRSSPAGFLSHFNAENGNVLVLLYI